MTESGSVLRAWAAASLLALPVAGAASPIDLDSREYKVGIDPAGIDPDPKAAFEAISSKLMGKISGLEFEEPRRGQVQFFGTPDCTLARNSMLLRSRMTPGKEPHITLKIRSADILIASTMPVTLADGKMVEFEDDYGIGPDGAAGSDYSRSLSYDGAAPTTLADLTEKFDHLNKVISTPLTEELLTGPLIDTLVHASKPYPLGPDTMVTIETSLWYAADDGAPLAGDVSFTLDAPFNYATMLAADNMLMTLSDALGPLRGASAEKAMAAIPKICR